MARQHMPVNYNKKRIFISYNRRDISQVEKIYRHLSTLPFYDTWLDIGLTPGTVDWQQEIQQNLENADVLILVMSPDAAQSRWVDLELDYASQHGIPVVPVLASGDPSISVPPAIQNREHIDIRKNIDKGIEELIAGIEKLSQPIEWRAKPAQTQKPQTWNYDIFLSYSHEDFEIMLRVKETFLGNQMSVWTDEILKPGTPSWQVAVEDAIENAGCLVCILSPDAKKSEWVREELNYAQICGLRIIPLLARGNNRTSLPFGYTLRQYVDIQRNYEEGMTETVRAVKEYLS